MHQQRCSCSCQGATNQARNENFHPGQALTSLLHNFVVFFPSALRIPWPIMKEAMKLSISFSRNRIEKCKKEVYWMRPNGHLGWHLTSLLKQNEEFFFLLPDQFQPVSSVVADRGCFRKGKSRVEFFVMLQSLEKSYDK